MAVHDRLSLVRFDHTYRLACHPYGLTLKTGLTINISEVRRMFHPMHYLYNQISTRKIVKFGRNYDDYRRGSLIDYHSAMIIGEYIPAVHLVLLEAKGR